MKKIKATGVKLPVDYSEKQLLRRSSKACGVSFENVESVRLIKRSVDARHKDSVHFLATVELTLKSDDGTLGEEADCIAEKYDPSSIYVSLKNIPKDRPVVVGSGPAGLFAALVLAKKGLRPIVIERGGTVKERTEAVNRMKKAGVLDTESNIQFGEGGAGTFSDGKLHTGIKDKRCAYVFKEFAANGAPEEILWMAKPHIGTDKLCTTIANMRESIKGLGGEFLFNTRVCDIEEKDGALCGITVEEKGGKRYDIECRHAIFAVGHSARDTFEMLYRHGLSMIKKPFAVGLRIEHKRELIDRSLYGSFAGRGHLGAADYKLSCVTESGVGVYSFCMCPGGCVVPASSEEGRLAVNGMSEFARDMVNSNSALLVGISPDMVEGDHPLSGVKLQRQLEEKAFLLGGGGFKAPVQLAGDFIKGKPSVSLGNVTPSYEPGFRLTDVSECLPAVAAEAIKQAIPIFDRKIEGFGAYDAVLTGVESRSSSPVRIMRDEKGMSSVWGIYPCGEGAGYAGGITSAAVDGIKCAERLIANMYGGDNV